MFETSSTPHPRRSLLARGLSFWILVFILAIGYYITPELVGGTKGIFISNQIAYHISTSLNWGLAAALGTLLLALVLVLYWLYDRLVGIDNVKLG